jgi:hypothetical protein
MAHRIAWDFPNPTRPTSRMKGTYDNFLLEKDAQLMCRFLNETWGENTHWVEKYDREAVDRALEMM